jgi:ubiquinone/menaquinone biosynthesis C-methylase UbiE
VSASALWHTSQYAEPNRSTTYLREFVARVLRDEDPPGEVLDAGCGGGAKMLHLADLLPDAHWTGVDIGEEALEIGREHLDPERFSLLHCDLTELEQNLGSKRFDICFSIMVLSCLEDYERAVDQMLAVTRRWLFVLSLFAETELDAFIRMSGRLAGEHQGLAAFYNIYSLPRFEEFCRQLGATEIIAEPFEIDIDIPRPNHGGMGTWTQRMADGHRIQLSGPLTMPWWFISIRL